MSTQAWQASYYVKDWRTGASITACHVSPLLCALLRISQCMGIAPVRLRRSRGNTLLELSPKLVFSQRLIIILSSITIIIGIVFDFKSNERVRVGTAIVTSIMWFAEVFHLMLICLIKVFAAPDTTERLIILLRQINKISRGLNHGAFQFRYPKFKGLTMFSFIIYVVLLHTCVWISCQFSMENHLVLTLYICFYYQSLVVQIIQLEMAIVVAELTSLATDLNDHLERLLHSISQNSADVSNSKYGYLTIRQFAQYHEQVWDMIQQVNDDSGPIWLLSFSLLFLYFLITPYNLILTIAQHHEVDYIIQQSCWAINHFITLIIMVEPCHWMQDEIDRTRYLLSRLARRSAEGDERFYNELDLFILQFQIKRGAITPMGVFTVSRPLAASVIGSVTTYLAILFQMHNVPELM